MSRVIRFHTTLFDITKERTNPINPIPGESLLLWLIDQAKPTGLVISPPEAEDWGWCSLVRWKDGRQYLLGASAEPPPSQQQNAEPCEWILQIEKQRSMLEALLGRAKMNPETDECARYFQDLLQREPAFRDLSIDPDNPR